MKYVALENLNEAKVKSYGENVRNDTVQKINNRNLGKQRMIDLQKKIAPLEKDILFMHKECKPMNMFMDSSVKSEKDEEDLELSRFPSKQSVRSVRQEKEEKRENVELMRETARRVATKLVSLSGEDSSKKIKLAIRRDALNVRMLE